MTRLNCFQEDLSLTRCPIFPAEKKMSRLLLRIEFVNLFVNLITVSQFIVVAALITPVFYFSISAVDSLQGFYHLILVCVV